MKWRSGNDGLVEFFIREGPSAPFQKVVSVLNTPTLISYQGLEGEHYLKHGLYRNGSPFTNTLWHDNFAVSTTYNAALATWPSPTSAPTPTSPSPNPQPRTNAPVTNPPSASPTPGGGPTSGPTSGSGTPGGSSAADRATPPGALGDSDSPTDNTSTTAQHDEASLTAADSFDESTDETNAEHASDQQGDHKLGEIAGPSHRRASTARRCLSDSKIPTPQARVILGFAKLAHPTRTPNAPFPLPSPAPNRGTFGLSAPSLAQRFHVS